MADIWEALPYSGTPLSSGTLSGNDLLAGTGIEAYYYSRSESIQALNSKVSTANTFIGSRCGISSLCTGVTGAIGAFTGAVDATFTPSASVLDGAMKGASGTFMGYGLGRITKNPHLGNQAGATYDMMNTFSE